MYLGDVPASTLWKTLIDTRETLAAIRNSHNIYDAFAVPIGLVRTSDGPDGGNTGNVLASKITCEILGRPFTSIHNVKRADWNAALAEMNRQIAVLQSPTGNTPNVATSVPTTGDTTSGVPVITATPPITTPITTTAPATNNTLYIVGGLGALAVLFAMKRKKG